MRKHKFMIGALVGAVGVFALASTANAAVVNQTYSQVTAKTKQDKKVRGPVGTFRTDIDTLYNVPPFTNYQPAGTQTVLRFDSDFRFDPGKLPTCSVASITGKDTAGAKAACGPSQVGQGASRVGTFTGATLNGTVTAFNGAKSGGRPTLALHVDLGPAVPTKPILLGTLTGTVLTVTIPVTPGTAITHFDTTINQVVSKVTKKKVKNKKTGKKKTKKIRTFFAAARCTDGRWAHQEVTTFQDGSSKLDASTPQACKAKKKKKKK